MSQTQNQSVKNMKACKHNYKCLYFQAEYKTRLFYKLKYISYLSVGAVVVAQVVVHRTSDQKVLGSIPAGSWAFFSSLSYQKCVLNQVPHGGASLLIFLFKKCLAVQLEDKQTK